MERQPRVTGARNITVAKSRSSCDQGAVKGVGQTADKVKEKPAKQFGVLIPQRIKGKCLHPLS